MTTEPFTRTAPGIDRDIYPMPAFVKFEAADLPATTRWYEAAGFVVLAAMPGPGGSTGLVHLRRQRYQDILLVPARGPAAGGGRVTMAAGGDDLRLRAADLLAAAGGGTVEGPAPTPWRSDDLTLTDPDGNVVVLTEPRRADIDADTQWSAMVRDSVNRTVA
ncbi:VOC family protein [Catellatospora sichuanensis]|uniref:VOC family protein n=1 Tax=Catellatospora sichuanensis TaxID=1969805 RepID=UPI0016432F7E|nr:VOC family protein [Catellatospora sichuanensis]